MIPSSKKSAGVWRMPSTHPQDSKGSSRNRSLRAWWIDDPPGEITAHRSGDLVCGDAIESISKVRDGVADIVFLDPPFNLGKAYGDSSPRADLLEEDQYA